jgi:hypothetical protein
MENVVYMLGAGFSAPLGLPVMNDFLLKAKDMYALDAKKYAYFENVFQKINSMAVTKSYYDADLFNIEEILSILEMRERLAGADTKTFVEFLCDVIDYYTPAVPTPRLETANWFDTVLGPWTHYFALAGSLLGIRLWTSTDPIHDIAVDISQLPNRKCSYAVVSLNYDLVLEYMAKAINAMTTKPGSVKCYFGKPDDDGGAGEEKIIVPLAKLHGSTHTRHVIAPTWNKGLESDSTIVETWATALKLLREANHIRIIGYSLPESDAYIRYLLKAAVIESPHLKSFDVICSDSSGQTRERYKAFVTFKYFRFAHGLTQDYLSNVFERKSADIPSMSVTFDGLERAHEDFIEAALT